MPDTPSPSSAAMRPAPAPTPRAFVVSCGGTGGHMFPGLAVAAELRRRGHRVAVVLSGRAVEAERAKADLPDGVEPILVPSVPVSPRRPLSLAKMGVSCLRARRALRRFRPDALLAMGSYTSIAPVLAARSLGVPVVLHEANAIPGSAVAHLARLARTVCLAFPDAARFLPKGVRTADTGLPLRGEFARGSASSKAAPDDRSLLVMGGSQGAQALNRMVVEALRVLSDLLEKDSESTGKPFRVVHLAGPGREEEVRTLYREAGVGAPMFDVEVVGFEHDMARRYAEARLCVSRAGASSCFELALTGLPAIFIPLPRLARNHQTRNAESFVARGAALLVAQNPDAAPDGPADSLFDSRCGSAGPIFAALLRGLLADRFSSVDAKRHLRLAEMREAMLERARPDAAARVADEVERAVRS